MTLGKPSIPTPRALDLRAVQSAIDNIRERFTFAESELNALRQLLEASKSTQDIGMLQKQVAALISSAGTGGAAPAADMVVDDAGLVIAQHVYRPALPPAAIASAAAVIVNDLNLTMAQRIFAAKQPAASTSTTSTTTGVDILATQIFGA